MPEGITVLQSTPAPRPTTNPYVVMLQGALRSHPAVKLRLFSWRTALIGRYDVFHVHWPEILTDGRSPFKRALRRLLTLMLIVRLRLSRIAVVRTVHNIELPRGLTRSQLALLHLLDSMTTLRIALNEHTPVGDGTAAAIIPHGHYRDWFARYRKGQSTAGRVGFFGLIRRYKGVEGLIAAFEDALASRPDLTLVIGGAATSPDLEKEIRRLAEGHSQIHLALHFLSDKELVELATSSELVVLPYRFMHNSGGALAALSLDRPILVPDNEVNRALEQEVGAGWVFLYDGDLSADALLRAVDGSASAARSAHPDLSSREWSTVGESHYRAYARAIDLRRAVKADT